MYRKLTFLFIHPIPPSRLPGHNTVDLLCLSKLFRWAAPVFVTGSHPSDEAITQWYIWDYVYFLNFLDSIFLESP